MKKFAEDLNGDFTKEYIQIDGQQTLIIREMQIKTTTRYHLTLGKMAIIKKIYK